MIRNTQPPHDAALASNSFIPEPTVAFFADFFAFLLADFFEESALLLLPCFFAVAMSFLDLL